MRASLELAPSLANARHTVSDTRPYQTLRASNASAPLRALAEAARVLLDWVTLA